MTDPKPTQGSAQDGRDSEAREAERDVWEYSFIHSSALGYPEETVGPCLTYDRAIAYGKGCFGQRELSVRARPAPEALGAAKGLTVEECLSVLRDWVSYTDAGISMDVADRGEVEIATRARTILAKANGEHSGSVDERDAARWRMHIRMMLRKHGAIEVRETIDAVDHAIAAKEQA